MISLESTVPNGSTLDVASQFDSDGELEIEMPTDDEGPRAVYLTKARVQYLLNHLQFVLDLDEEGVVDLPNQI